jgi:hypothetical protein
MKVADGQTPQTASQLDISVVMVIAFAWNWILDGRFIWAPRSDARQAR